MKEKAQILSQNFIFLTVSRAKGRPYHKNVGVGSIRTGGKERIKTLLLAESLMRLFSAFSLFSLLSLLSPLDF